MSREDVASDSLELQGDAQDTNLDLREASPPQDTATAAVQSIEPASDSSDPATQTRKCRVFGSSNTANTLAVLALLVAAIGLSWTICYSFLSQRWTIRNDTLQDCLNFRQVEIVSERCNITLQQGVLSFWRKRGLIEPENSKPWLTTTCIALYIVICLLVMAARCCKRDKRLKLDVERALPQQHGPETLQTYVPEMNGLRDRGETLRSTSIWNGSEQHNSISRIARRRVEARDSPATDRRPHAWFYCQDCNAIFKRQGDLARHRDTAHVSLRKSYRCTMCVTELLRLDKMREHCRAVHGQSRDQQTFEVVEH